MPVLEFANPWLLTLLAALPILWMLLRAIPPAPIRRRFPGVALLLGLSDEESQSDRTPWWLLLIRILAVAAMIIGFAGPVINPAAERPGRGAVAIVIDGSWADAADWPTRLERVADLLDGAGASGRPAAVVVLADPPAGGAEFRAASEWKARLRGLSPRPWMPSDGIGWVERTDGRFDTWWLSDGLARDSRVGLLRALDDRGNVTVFESGRPVTVIEPPVFRDGVVTLTLRRSAAAGPLEVGVSGLGPDPSGVERALATGTAIFAEGEDAAEIEINPPPDLRNRITRFAVDGIRSAGAVALADDALRRREVALLAGEEEGEAPVLLSPLHYLRQALGPSADLIETATLGDALPGNPDVIVMADVAGVATVDVDPLTDWLNEGGLLVRFAGPRLAAEGAAGGDSAFLPTRLRAGGTTVGGAMSWGEAKKLRAFERGSPFFGLPVPDEVGVTSQVLAQPDPRLAERTIASLEDGTPLVTSNAVGAGMVVLFHVTANAEWSTLPLSELFVRMLERLSISTPPPRRTPEDLAGIVWTPVSALTAFGEPRPADDLPGVPGEVLAIAEAGPETPPGVYDGGGRLIALNAVGPDTELRAASWPDRITVERLTPPPEFDLTYAALLIALILMIIDSTASLRVGGHLTSARAAALLAALALAPESGWTQGRDSGSDALAVEVTSEVALAHVLTGDRRVDALARAGLAGLAEALIRRTAVEPIEPVAVNIETDELAFHPILFWPVTADQPTPSIGAYQKLNRYLRSGGMILFDTRDAHIGGSGGTSAEARALRRLAAALDIPVLEPIPPDHVLTRTFYLLRDFPGRHRNGTVWVEASPADAEASAGMPFRNLNDGVTPVVIGGNDWASAWAIDGSGRFLYPVGRGPAGERQRELAYRFGINLLMHALTGNYKNDQVHVPALLDRLGQ